MTRWCLGCEQWYDGRVCVRCRERAWRRSRYRARGQDEEVEDEVTAYRRDRASLFALYAARERFTARFHGTLSHLAEMDAGTDSEIVTQSDVHVIIPEQLLIGLRELGMRLSGSSNPLVRQWGLHLLEDWRSLSLLAEAGKVSEAG